MSGKLAVRPPRRLSPREVPGPQMWNDLLDFAGQFAPIDTPDVQWDVGPSGMRPRVQRAQMAQPLVLSLGDMWELFQAEEDAPGLVMSMRPGLLVHTASTTLFPLHDVVSWTAAAVPDDATTEFWLRVSVVKSSYQAYFDVWPVSGFEVETGAAVPADTLDLSTETAGDIHFPIGTVTAAAGEITVITQIRAAMPVVVVFPLSVALFDGVCPEPPEEE